MNETNEKINIFVKKGFLLDKESLEFLLSLEDIKLSEDILNHLFTITHTRILPKKIFLENYTNLKPFLEKVAIEKKPFTAEFFKESLLGNLASAVKQVQEPKTAPKLEDCIDVKILSSQILPYRKIEVKDFVTHFRNRYNLFKELLVGRKELENLISINKIGNTRNFSIIGIVANKRITKNKNIILEVEDLTGKINILISHDKEKVVKNAKEAVMDDVIGIKCSGKGEFIYANDIVFADSFLAEKKKLDEEAYALFISDIHIGSKLFLKEKFERFISWINGIEIDDPLMAEKIKKIKYILIAGDNVDGVGVYPGQEHFLEVKDIKEQYHFLAEAFKRFPSHVKIIMCPGQHDGVRVPEPQPALDAEFAEELTKMNNVFLISNPSLVEIGSSGQKKGLKILFYHGASMIRNWMDEIEELRLSRAHLNPTKISKYMLRHRHLSPTHSSNVYIPAEKEDLLALKEVPDILFTGDLHKADIDLYNNVLLVSGSCWQSATPFEEKVGNHPDPCKVPMLNLKTREIKILDFS